MHLTDMAIIKTYQRSSQKTPLNVRLTWYCWVYLVDVSEGGVLRGTVQVNPSWTEGGVEPCRHTDMSL